MPVTQDLRTNSQIAGCPASLGTQFSQEEHAKISPNFKNNSSSSFSTLEEDGRQAFQRMSKIYMRPQ